MIVVKIPEDGKRFIEYAEEGFMLSFGDDELIINLKKRERDEEVTLDVCRDYLGGLTLGTGGAKEYVAEIIIPARRYEEKAISNPGDTSGEEEVGDNVAEIVPLPFDMERVELHLFEEVL